ncbi:MAG: L-lysine 6-transaminase [Planctomycetes bacterium]|nr:L-lysine 6-transaminase [Planctomycetota bacterium]
MTLLHNDVHEALGKHLLIDGLPIVFDLDSSHGSWVVDAKSGKKYLDFFSFFASLPLGFNHPALTSPAVKERLLQAAIHKPSNSDAYTDLYAQFVSTFSELALPPHFVHLFFIEGGALAVENALKVAFDWKIRKNMAAGKSSSRGSQVLHFREAFHGRSGYTLSLTNTDPVKIDFFPKFNWPRVPNPKIHFPLTEEENARVEKAERESRRAIEEAFERCPDDIAAIIIETIQGEGGDNHFRGEFLKTLREVADRREAMLIFDEVQCGMGLTGKLWAYEHFDVKPDILVFGKKSQVCGLMASRRVDEVKDNVFRIPSRINSTWGGNLVDMARCEAILNAIHEEELVGNAARVGAYLLKGLQEAASPYPGLVTNVRGRGLMCAFDLPSKAASKAVQKRALDKGLLLLLCGPSSIRMRPALTLGRAEVDAGREILDQVFRELAREAS